MILFTLKVVIRLLIVYLVINHSTFVSFKRVSLISLVQVVLNVLYLFLLVNFFIFINDRKFPLVLINLPPLFSTWPIELISPFQVGPIHLDLFISELFLILVFSFFPLLIFPFLIFIVSKMPFLFQVLTFRLFFLFNFRAHFIFPFITICTAFLVFIIQINPLIDFIHRLRPSIFIDLFLSIIFLIPLILLIFFIRPILSIYSIPIIHLKPIIVWILLLRSISNFPIWSIFSKIYLINSKSFILHLNQFGFGNLIFDLLIDWYLIFDLELNWYLIFNLGTIIIAIKVHSIFLILPVVEDFFILLKLFIIPIIPLIRICWYHFNFVLRTLAFLRLVNQLFRYYLDRLFLSTNFHLN